MTRLRAGGADVLSELIALLEGLDPVERIHAVRGLTGSDQARLWELCEGRLVSLDDMVPAAIPDGQIVIHYGKNSLPAFTLFEKRFCRAPGGKALWGYNHQTLMNWTGPGYYVADVEAETGSLAIDYRRLPDQAMNGAPPLRSNGAGLSRFIYKDMVDRMRLVGAGVTVGRVWKYGRWQNNYFMLCRGPLEQSS